MGHERVESVIRAAKIIENLAEAGSEKSLVEIAREVKLHIATTRRLLLTLKHVEFVKQNQENKKYALGLKLFLIGKSLNSSLDLRLRQISLPYLKELMEKSGETTNLIIEDQDQAVYIEQVECNNYLRTANKVGSRAPLHCTAVGKIILSSRTPEERRKYLDGVSLLPLTSRTITDKGKLLSELEEISKKHFAVDNEEQMIGERCLAVSVFNQSGKTIGAISISGPDSRLTSKKMKELKPTIQEVGLMISKEMGFEERGYLVKKHKK